MFCGGKVPFGYRLEIEQAADNAKPVKKVVVYEEDAEIIRFIFTQYADGKTEKHRSPRLRFLRKKRDTPRQRQAGATVKSERINRIDRTLTSRRTLFLTLSEQI